MAGRLFCRLAKALKNQSAMPNKLLILTVGLPRSGKSTWSQKMGHPIVSPDAIRLALHGQRFVATAEPIVWATAKLMVASLFEAGHSAVIVDACHNTIKRRNEWLDSRWEIKLVSFPADAAPCIARARMTGREDLIPVIERMNVESDWRE